LLFRLATNDEQQFDIIGYLLITVLAANRHHSSTGVRRLGPDSFGSDFRVTIQGGGERLNLSSSEDAEHVSAIICVSI